MLALCRCRLSAQVVSNVRVPVSELLGPCGRLCLQPSGGSGKKHAILFTQLLACVPCVCQSLFIAAWPSVFCYLNFHHSCSWVAVCFQRRRRCSCALLAFAPSWSSLILQVRGAAGPISWTKRRMRWARPPCTLRPVDGDDRRDSTA